MKGYKRAKIVGIKSSLEDKGETKNLIIKIIPYAIIIALFSSLIIYFLFFRSKNNDKIDINEKYSLLNTTRNNNEKGLIK